MRLRGRHREALAKQEVLLLSDNFDTDKNKQKALDRQSAKPTTSPRAKMLRCHQRRNIDKNLNQNNRIVKIKLKNIGLDVFDDISYVVVRDPRACGEADADFEE